MSRDKMVNVRLNQMELRKLQRIAKNLSTNLHTVGLSTALRVLLERSK